MRSKPQPFSGSALLQIPGRHRSCSQPSCIEMHYYNQWARLKCTIALFAACASLMQVLSLIFAYTQLQSLLESLLHLGRSGLTDRTDLDSSRVVSQLQQIVSPTEGHRLTPTAHKLQRSLLSCPFIHSAPWHLLT